MLETALSALILERLPACRACHFQLPRSAAAFADWTAGVVTPTPRGSANPPATLRSASDGVLAKQA